MPVITDKFGKASIDNNYAIATTVKTTRTAGTAVLEAFDLSKFNPDTPVFVITYKKVTDPLTGVVSVTNLVSWKALVNVGANTLTNLTLAPGYVDGGNAIGDFIECIPTSYWENSLIDGIFVGHNPDGTFKLTALKDALGLDGMLVQSLDDLVSDTVVSGGVWSVVSGLNGAMTLCTAYQAGLKSTAAAIATRAFTINKDTYVDILRGGTLFAPTFSVVYTEVANGAASPALAANSIRLAKVITNGSAITSILQRYMDSLGNLYRPLPDGTKSVDANGWTVYEHGTFRRYRKRLTFSQTIAGLAILTVSSTNLPEGMPTIAAAFMGYSWAVTSNAGALQIAWEGSTGSAGLQFTTATTDTLSRAYSGYIDMEFTTA